MHNFIAQFYHGSACQSKGFRSCMKASNKIQILVFFLTACLVSGISRASTCPQSIFSFPRVTAQTDNFSDESYVDNDDPLSFHNHGASFKCAYARRVYKSKIRLQHSQRLIAKPNSGAEGNYTILTDNSLIPQIFFARPYYYTFLFRLTPF
jgi:hypothetical protein